MSRFDLNRSFAISTLNLALSSVLFLPMTSIAADGGGPSFLAGQIQTMKMADGLLVQVAPLTSSSEVITVDLLASHKQISAIFDTQKPGDRMWSRLWFSKGASSIASAEKTLLRKHFKAAQNETHSELSDADFARAQSLTDFLANFLPTGETLKPFDSHVNLPTGFMAQFQAVGFVESHYTPICDSIGTLRQATFTNKVTHETLSQIVAVGAIDSSCRGRCGKGCEQAGQWRHNQYTQECLNHDVCHDTTGYQLGPCEDQFWQAAPGYLFAPDCTKKAVAIGPDDKPTTADVPTPPSSTPASQTPVGPTSSSPEKN